MGLVVWLGMEPDEDGGIQNDFQDFGLSNWVDSGPNNRKGTMRWGDYRKGRIISSISTC